MVSACVCPELHQHKNRSRFTGGCLYLYFVQVSTLKYLLILYILFIDLNLGWDTYLVATIEQESVNIITVNYAMK